MKTYYDLTKEQYKKFEKEFKKLYVSKQYTNAQLVSGIIGCILWGLAGGIIGYNSIEAIQVGLNEIALFFIGGSCLLESFLLQIEYKKELKNYIIEKKLKKD